MLKIVIADIVGGLLTVAILRLHLPMGVMLGAAVAGTALWYGLRRM